MSTYPASVSRLRGIAAGSMCRPRSASTRREVAPPTAISRSVSAGHSACHGPAPRCSSCGPAASRVATRPGARAAAGARGHRGDRVVLVRHRRRATGRGLVHLTDLGLGQQHEVAGHLADRNGDAAERTGELGDAGALGVPDPVRVGQPELVGQGGPHGRAVRVQGRECARRPTELHGEPVARGGQAGAGAVEPGAPYRCERAEGRGHGLLQQRPPGHRGGAVLAGQGGGGVGAVAQARPARRRSRVGRPASSRCRGCPGWSRRDARRPRRRRPRARRRPHATASRAG